MTLATSVLPTPAWPSISSGFRRLRARCTEVATGASVTYSAASINSWIFRISSTHEPLFYMKPRVVVGRIDVGRHRRVDGHARHPVGPRAAPPPAPRRRRRVRRSSAKDLGREEHRRALRPAVDRRDDRPCRCARAPRSSAGMTPAGSRGWSPSATSAAVGVTAPAPRRRPRSTSPARPPAADSPTKRTVKPAERRPHRRVVVPRDHDQILHVRHNTPRPLHRTTGFPRSSSSNFCRPIRRANPAARTIPAIERCSPVARCSRLSDGGPARHNVKAPASRSRAPERMLH